MAGFHDDTPAGLFTCCGLGPECPFQPCLLCLICSNSAPTTLGTSSTAASSRAPASSLAPSLQLCTNLFLWSPTAACSVKTQCWYWVLYSTMSQAQSLTTAFSVHFEQNEHETIKHKSIQNSDCEWTSVIKVGIKNKLRVPPCGLTYLPHTQPCLWEKGDIPVVVQRQATQLVECPTN